MHTLRSILLRHCRILQLSTGLLLLPASPSAAATPPTESNHYRLVTLPTPAGVTFEAGSTQFLPDGRLALSTRLGDIYLLDHPLSGDAANLHYSHFASGLHEVLGLAWKDGWLYATQRGEITRMKDTDGDGRADLFETVCDDWGITGDYHEYAFGSKFDAEGNLWIVLCLTGSFTSETRYRGWCLRITPEGKAIPTCSGVRSPGGIGTNHLGEMFFTDNQGPWNGACALKHLVPGDFMGNPSGNKWYSLTDALGPRPADPQSGSRMHLEARKIERLRPPPVYYPYAKMGQSASGIACDTTGNRFGPFTHQIFVGEQTHSTVMRTSLEKVNQRYQGACYPFREGLDSGTLALEFAPDGSLICYGTDRGWGSRGGKPFALQRLVFTGRTPFEILEMKAAPDGFDLLFTAPVDPEPAAKPESYDLQAYTYIYQASYGSPEVDASRPVIRSATVGSDGTSVHLHIDGLVEGHIHELKAAGIRSRNGEPLLHSMAYYTLNNIPKAH